MDEEATFDPAAPFRELTATWLRSSQQLSRGVGRMYRNLARANRALVRAPTLDDGHRTARRAPDSPEMGFSRTDWETERTVDEWEEIDVGDTVRFTKTMTEEDVTAFATASGDTNRLHLDDDFARETRFERRIVHGTLASGLISAALARLPGLTIYLSQDIEFLRPVDIGDRLTAVVEVVEEIGDGRYRLSTTVENEEGEEVVDGEAVVIIDELP